MRRFDASRLSPVHEFTPKEIRALRDRKEGTGGATQAARDGLYRRSVVRSYAEALATARTDKPVKGIVLNWFSIGKVSVA